MPQRQRREALAFPIAVYHSSSSLRPLQVLTRERVGFGDPIGQQLRRSPDAKLVVGSSVPTAHHDAIQALLDGCGHVDRKQRPRMEVVLQEVNTMIQNLAPVEDTTTDRVALMELFEATNGESWKSSSGWGTSRPLGEWHGVTVDSGGRVVKLHRQYSILKGGCNFLVFDYADHQ